MQSPFLSLRNITHFLLKRDVYRKLLLKFCNESRIYLPYLLEGSWEDQARCDAQQSTKSWAVDSSAYVNLYISRSLSFSLFHYQGVLTSFSLDDSRFEYFVTTHH